MAKKQGDIPSSKQIREELGRVRYRARYRRVLRSTIYALIVTAAAAALIATLVLPVLQIYGTSMSPTLSEGNIVLTVKTKNFKRGDIISFYFSNRILVKRVIGLPMDLIEIDGDGNVTVNGESIEEDYLTEKALGECDLEFPFRVPEASFFVMGDHRATSIDSRTTTVGCILQEEIVGKIIFTVWPFKEFGTVR